MPQDRALDSTAFLDLDRARDLRGHGVGPWFRRLVLALLVAFLAAAVLGAFGQRARERSATGAAATVALRAPGTLRGGLMWPARITVRARTRIARPRLVLARGWFEGAQLNSMEPAAADEDARPDAVVFGYGPLEAGDVLTVHLQLQVNPDTVGRQDLSVVLEGDDVAPVRLPTTLTVLP